MAFDIFRRSGPNIMGPAAPAATNRLTPRGPNPFEAVRGRPIRPDTQASPLINITGSVSQSQVAGAAQGRGAQLLQERLQVHGDPRRAIVDLFQSPEFPELLAADPTLPEQMLQMAEGMAGPEPEGFTLSEGQRRFERAPDGTVREIAGVDKPPEPITQAEVVGAGDARAAELGLNVPEGDNWEVKTETDPTTGEQRVVDVNAIGGGDTSVNVDLGSLAEKEAMLGNVRQLISRRNEVLDRKGAAIEMVQIAQRLDEQLDAEGAGGLSLAGFLTRAGNTVSAQAQAIAQRSGLPFDPDVFDLSAFPKEAAGSAALRSNVLALGYLTARAQHGGGVLSERDVQNGINRLAASSGSVEQMRAALGEVVQQSVQGIDAQIQAERSTYEGTPVAPPSFLRDDLEALGVRPPQRTAAQAATPVTSIEDVQRLSTDAIARFLQGMSEEEKAAFARNTELMDAIEAKFLAEQQGAGGGDANGR